MRRRGWRPPLSEPAKKVSLASRWVHHAVASGPDLPGRGRSTSARRLTDQPPSVASSSRQGSAPSHGHGAAASAMRLGPAVRFAAPAPAAHLRLSPAPAALPQQPSSRVSQQGRRRCSRGRAGPEALQELDLHRHIPGSMETGSSSVSCRWDNKRRGHFLCDAFSPISSAGRSSSLRTALRGMQRRYIMKRFIIKFMPFP